MQHLQLMAQREDLEVERDPRPHPPPERRKKGNQDGRHRDQSLSASAGKFNGANTYDIFQKAQAVVTHNDLPAALHRIRIALTTSRP